MAEEYNLNAVASKLNKPDPTLGEVLLDLFIKDGIRLDRVVVTNIVNGKKVNTELTVGDISEDGVVEVFLVNNNVARWPLSQLGPYIFGIVEDEEEEEAEIPPEEVIDTEEVDFYNPPPRRDPDEEDWE